MNDPRPDNVYNKLYSVKYLGNMSGQETVYLNQPIEVLKYLAVASIKANEVYLYVEVLFRTIKLNKISDQV